MILACDDCHTQRQGLPGQSADDLRLKLRGVGWLILDDGDWCPRCRS